MKILITGAQGQLGLALQRQFANRHEVVAFSRADLDITQLASCRAAIDEHRPQIVLNCAAYTAVDRAESDSAAAMAINGEGAGQLARACRELDVFPVHFSTDYVFDGEAQRPYTEDDAVSPQSVYGRSKLVGEQAVARESPQHLILRLSWVYGNDGANFYKTMLRLAAERPELRVVADQFGTPNCTVDLATGVASAIDRPRQELDARSGLYHLSSTGVTSWCEFARAIVQRTSGESVVVRAITTSEYPTAAKRPAYSALDGRRFAATFGWASPSWQDGLQRCLAARLNIPEPRG